MENKPGSSTWERSTTRRFSQWLTSPKTLRRLLITMAWAASIIALYYGLVDWQGRRAWNEYRHNYEGHVASLQWADYIPKSIPDSENFAATPFAEALFKHNNDTNFLLDRDAWSRAWTMIKNPPKKSGEAYQQKYQDLVAWQEAFAAVESGEGKHIDEFRTDKLDLTSRAQAAPAVLSGLQDDDAAFNELRAASSRPEARYPVVYNMKNPMATLLPHLAKIKGICQRLELKACAELAAGQNEKALDDVKLMMRVSDSLKSEPFLITYLVRIACTHITMVPIWEGLAEHRWADGQLQQLQSRLEQYDFLADFHLPMQGERAMGIFAMDLLKGRGLGLLADWQENGPSKPMLNFVGRFVPAGWYDQEKLHYCMGADALFKGIMDLPSRRVYPSLISANVAERNNFHTNVFMDAVVYHRIFSMLLTPALARIPTKSAVTQAYTDEATIACGLERYRLANGQFPDSLDALAPRFINRLPNDVITGDPYKYRRTDDGRFVLYSVGWNEKDDGGVPGKVRFDETEGDWVWEYPAP